MFFHFSYRFSLFLFAFYFQKNLFFVFFKLFLFLLATPARERKSLFFILSNGILGNQLRVITLLLYALCDHNTIQFQITHTVPDVEELQIVEAKRVRLVGHQCFIVFYLNISIYIFVRFEFENICTAQVAQSAPIGARRFAARDKIFLLSLM